LAPVWIPGTSIILVLGMPDDDYGDVEGDEDNGDKTRGNGGGDNDDGDQTRDNGGETRDDNETMVKATKTMVTRLESVASR